MERRDYRGSGYRGDWDRVGSGEVRGYKDYQGKREHREVKESVPKTSKKVNRKKFVRYKEGAEMYSMSQSKFEDMAKDAEAVYKLNKMVLVNCDIFEEYLETFWLRNE